MSFSSCYKRICKRDPTYLSPRAYFSGSSPTSSSFHIFHLTADSHAASPCICGMVPQSAIFLGFLRTWQKLLCLLCFMIKGIDAEPHMLASPLLLSPSSIQSCVRGEFPIHKHFQHPHLQVCRTLIKQRTSLFSLSFPFKVYVSWHPLESNLSLGWVPGDSRNTMLFSSLQYRGSYTPFIISHDVCQTSQKPLCQIRLKIRVKQTVIYSAKLSFLLELSVWGALWLTLYWLLNT